MKIAGIDFPNDCPKDCSFKNDFSIFGQSSICGRCPIFNCGGEFKLLECDEYREDWVKEWKRFFDGEIKFPILIL